MNLNKNFLTEVIKYLINRGVTLAEVMDTFNEHFYTSDNAIKNEQEKHDEVRKPITDIDLLLCGRSVEESSTPCEKVDVKPVSKSWIDYPKTVKNHGNGVSPARKALFDVVGDKTVIEHLRANGIEYKVYDNRVRRKWSVADACTTPLAPRGRHKRVIEEPEETETAVIVPDNVKVVEESSTLEKPAETLETQTETLETQSNTEKAAEIVTIEPQIKTDTDTRVNDADVNNDVKNSESERIEQLTDKTVRDIVTGKNKEKKKTEPKRDYTASDLCLKLGLTTHELREKIEMGEIPQPDCGNKWSAKLLKDKDIILFF